MRAMYGNTVTMQAAVWNCEGMSASLGGGGKKRKAANGEHAEAAQKWEWVRERLCETDAPDVLALLEVGAESVVAAEWF